MTSTEQKIFEIISNKARVSIFEIAKKMEISTDYAHLICRGLKRHSYIDISGNYCNIKENKLYSAKIVKDKKKEKFQGEKQPFLFGLQHVTKNIAKILREAGYKSVKDIIEVPFSIFVQKTGLDLSQAAKIFNEARKKAGLI